MLIYVFIRLKKLREPVEHSKHANYIHISYRGPARATGHSVNSLFSFMYFGVVALEGRLKGRVGIFSVGFFDSCLRHREAINFI